jgi:hypothetical protein
MHTLAPLPENGATVAHFRELFQPQHAPYLLQGCFGECALLGGERCAFGIEPQGAFLFRCELLQSHAHKRELNPLEPVGRFARLHAEILPPSSRNLPQGREQRKCLPRFGQRAGVASAGAVLKREKYTASASWFLLNASGNQPPKIGSLTLQQAGRVCGMDTQRTRVSGYCREGAKAQSAVCSVREALYIPRGGGTVDAGDLKSSGATRAGSNPALGT